MVELLPLKVFSSSYRLLKILGLSSATSPLQGPVVQSIISLTKLLVKNLSSFLAYIKPSMLLFFAVREHERSSCSANAPHIWLAKMAMSVHTCSIHLKI